MMLQLIAFSVFGLALLLAGWPLFRILLVLGGALAGFTLGPELLQVFTGTVASPVAGWFSALFAALLLASLSWLVFRLAVFVGSAAVVYALVFSGSGNPVLSLVVALAAGLLASLLQRPAIIVISSVAGAWLLVSASLSLWDQTAHMPVELSVVTPWAWLVLAVVAVLGILAQLRQAPAARQARGGW